jgi:hypothetical protein
MIITLSTYDIADCLLRDSNACWTRAGAFALAEYLQEMEESTGEQIEFDAVAIRCDYSQWSSAVEAYNETSAEENLSEDDEDSEEKALEWLRDNGQVIEFDGGVIISN